MSRKRKEKREKHKELARQMGVKTSEVSEHHYLQEQERVTRPELRLVEREKARGLGGLLGGGAGAVAAAVYVVEASRTRCAGAIELSEKAAQLPKISYSRPARFVVIVVEARDRDLLSRLAPETVKGYAEARYASPAAVELQGRPAAVASVPGVDRTRVELRFPLGKAPVVVEVAA